MKSFFKRLLIITAVLSLALVSIITNFLQRNNTQQLEKSPIASVDEKLPYIEENAPTNNNVVEANDNVANSPTETNNPPIVSFSQMGGELLKGTDKVTFTITDPDGDNILYIKYHWDYYVNNNNAKIRECDGTASTVSARISPPQTNGIHLLRISGVDDKGAQSPWYIIPYYVVDSYSEVKDSTPPEFDWSKPSELPRNLSDVEVGQEITIRAKDDESGLYYIAYSWARENETPSYTLVNQPIDGKVTTTVPNETGKWYLRIFAANSTYNNEGNYFEATKIYRYEYNVRNEDIYELVVPTKLIYKYGEALDLTGAKIIVTSPRGVKSEIPATEEMFTNFTTTTLYANFALFTYNNVTEYYRYYVDDYILRIDVTNPNKVIYEYGEELELTGAKVQKIMASGATTLARVVTEDMLVNEFNPRQLGRQMLEINYDDNIAYIIVEVVDTTKPVITLNGEEEIDLLLGEDYVEAGATALDEVSGSVEVIPSGEVNTNTIGDYTITYTAVDGNNNIATATRKVYVRENATDMLDLLTITGTSVTYDPDNSQSVDIELPEGAGDATITYYKDGVKVDEPTDVGTYEVRLSTERGTQYAALEETQVATLTINPIPADALIVTLDINEYTYDGTAKTPAVTVKNGDTILTEDTDYIVNYDNNIDAGTATVTVTGINSYSSQTTKNFHITEKTLYVTAENTSRKYGEENPIFTYTYSGNVDGQTPEFTGALTTEATLNSAVGSYDILQGTLALADNEDFKANNYTIDYSKAILAINTNEIVVTADSKSKTYGEENPSLTYTFTGEKNNEIPAFAGELTTEARTLSNAGEYDILQGTLRLIDNGDFKASNYTLEYNKSTLTINKRDITVKAKDASKIYDGTALTSTDADITQGDILDSETITLVTQGSITNVGNTTNELVSVTIAGTLGNTTSNYNITKVNGTLTITPRVITVTAKSDEKVYDGQALTNANVILGGTIAPNEELVTTVTGSITNVGSTENVLESLKIRNALNEDTTANYNITTDNGTLTVTEKEITVTAENKEKVYGEENPELTYTNSDAIEGEVVKFSGKITTDATVGSIAGVYDITKGNLELVDNGAFIASNYSLNYVGAKLTVTPRDIIVKSSDANKEYDGTALTKHQVSLESGSLATGDTMTAGVTGTITDVGSTPNTIDKVTITNASNEEVTNSYNITKQAGTLTITSKTITATVDNKTKVYGEANPELTYELTAGIVGQIPLLTGSLATTAQTNSDVGTYPITKGTLTLVDNGDFKASNYTLNVVEGTLTITEKTLTVSAAKKSRAYGDENPNLTYIYKGVIDGESPNFDGSLATTATVESNVGTYPITKGTLTLIDNGDFKASNYTLVFEEAILKVTPRELTVTADANTKVYGNAIPELTYTYSNNVGGQTPEFTGDLATNGTVNSNVGEYNITKGTLALANSDTFATTNYTLNYVGAKLTVTPRDIIVKSVDDSKEYDGTALTNHNVSTSEGDLVEGDQVSAKVTGTITDVGHTANTIETVTISNASGDATDNYNITKEAGTLIITSKTITVKANNKERKYKAQDPEFDYTYEAEIVGQTPGFKGTLTTTATADSIVGTYQITQGTLELADKGDFKASNYTLEFVPGTLTIGKATYDMSGIVFEDKTVTYDRTVKSVEVNEDSLPDGVTVSYVNNDQTDAGTYIVTANFAVSEEYAKNYNVPESMTATLKINKASYDMSGVLFENKTVTYDRTAKTIEIDTTTLPSGVSVSYVGNNKVDAGIYTVTANFAVSEEYAANYNVPSSMNAILTITKATYDMSEVVFEDASVEYDGTAKTIEATNLPDGVSVAGYTGNDKVNAGTYTVTVNFTVADTTNYEIPSSIDKTLTITPRAITVKSKDAEKVYDETALTNHDYSIESGSLATGDALAVEITGTITNAGSTENTIGKVTVSNISGDATANYNITKEAGTLTITKATYDMAQVIFENKEYVYDGTAKNIEVTASTLPTGVIVTSYDNNGKTDVETYTVTANFGVQDELNYKVPDPIQATLTITPRAITVKSADDEKAYDGTPLINHDYSIASGSLVAGDVVIPEITGTITNYGSTENTIVTATISNVSGDVTSNYEITIEAGTLTITKSTPGLSIEIEDGAEVNIDNHTTQVIPTLTGEGELTGTISYEMDAGDIATIDATTGEITLNKITNNNITVTATYSGDDNTESVTATTQFKIVDITLPVITLNGDSTIVVKVGEDYEDLGATATDNYDGNITDDIVTVNPVDTTKIETYKVTYNVSDSSGNAATEVTRTVKVVDEEKPLITVIGDKTFYVEYNTPFVDPGATAHDGYDGDITNKITKSGTVDTSKLGEYTITYNVTDLSGNAADEETRTVIVRDSTAPTISLDENNTYEMEVFGEIPEFRARATDNYDATVNVTISTEDINPNVVGTYTVTFTATDTNNNPAIVEKEFKVKDSTKPVITVSEDNVYSMEVKGTKPQFIATATDNYDGNIDVDITDNINVNVVGTYTVTFTATDVNGNTAIEEKEFEVKDTTKPVITLNSTTPITIEVKTAYVDSGATASDNYDGDITSRIVTESDVDSNTIGSYTVKYNVTDANGNAADEVTRVVRVIDTQKPTITLIGESTVTIQAGTEYTDAGATASDNYDGDITSRIQTTNPVDTAVLGTYTVRYNVSDTSGNAATEVTRTVNVIDTQKPVITLVGESEITIEVGSTYTDAGATALDNYDGDITDDITVSGTVNTTVLDTYTLIYNVEDKQGNPAEPVTRTIHVVDTTKPVITLNGDATVTVQVGTAYVDAGATASDNYDGNITDDIVIVNPVDSTRVGTYTITYNVKDAHDNIADEVTRIVNVVDSELPEITLNPNNVYSMEVKGIVPEFNATATDNYDEHITVEVTHNIDKNTVGTYTVTFTAKDSSNNTATVEKIFSVVDTQKPTIEINGYNPKTIEVGTTYVDEGITITDNYDTSFEPNIVSTVDTSVVGDYTVTYNVADSSGNAADTKIRTVHVVDTTAPVITLNGESEITIEVGTTYTDAGVVVTDNYDTEIASRLVTTNDVNVDVVGDYTVTYNVTDEKGNPAFPKVRTVKVVDSTKPVISIDENNVYKMEVNGTKPQFVATATDNYDGDIDVVITDNIDVTTVGTYTVTFTATDRNNNTQKIEMPFRVEDTTAPEITLDSNNKYSMEVNTDKPVFSATAVDNNDGEVTVSITDNINTSLVGEYTVTFTASDKDENTAVVQRKFKVQDTISPVITLNGESSVIVPVGESYVDAGATATDNYDANVRVNATGSVDTTTIGTYKIYYNATDTIGNVADTKTRTINVVDRVKPTISLPVDVQYFEAGASYTRLTPTVSDNYNSVSYLLDSLTVSDINMKRVGTQIVTYTVRDSSGNSASALVAVVIEDTTKPTIAFANPSDANQSYTVGGKYTSPEFITTDNSNGEIIVKRDGIVDSETPGTYTVKYWAVDESGNKSGELTVTVKVLNYPPVITYENIVLNTNIVLYNNVTNGKVFTGSVKIYFKGTGTIVNSTTGQTINNVNAEGGYTITEAGTYTVTARLSDGASSTVSFTVVA